MQLRRYLRNLRAAALSLALIGVVGVPEAGSAPQTRPVIPAPPTFNDFATRVQDYLKLHKATPKLRTTRQRQEIVDRRHELAEKIRAARANAKAGDIFTPEISAQFRQAIQSTFQASGAPEVRKTIRQGEPLKGWTLSVNADYPEHLPVTTVPPTLLLRLPRLPAEVAYRIVGHDLVLEDIQARLIVDFIPGALP